MKISGSTREFLDLAAALAAFNGISRESYLNGLVGGCALQIVAFHPVFACQPMANWLMEKAATGDPMRCRSLIFGLNLVVEGRARARDARAAADAIQRARDAAASAQRSP